MTVNEATLEETVLKDYGDSIVVYVGQGTLTLKDGRKLNSKFEAGQLSDGEVLLLCNIMPPDLSICFTTIAVMSFEGLTAEGYTRQSGNSHYHILPLTLEDENSRTELSISPLEHYTKIKRRIKTLRGTDVTCEVISDTLQDGSMERLREVIDDLCYLLSIARGTKIQWIYCDRYDESGGLVMRTHSSRVTKPFCSLTVIDPRCDGSHETKTFLEQTYRAYVSKRDSHRLNRGMIDAYLDAKAENDYLQTRGVKLAVAFEMLKGVLLELPDSSAKEFVLEQEDFKKHVQSISETIEKILQQGGVEKNDRKAICSEKKIEGLNRRAFRYFIGKLCKQIDLKVEENEIRLFVACRDKLVHMGRFYCEVANNEERKECPHLPSETDEYFFLINFLDRIFLKLLGYSGTYIDWRPRE